MLAFGDREIVLHLQIHPELRRVTEVPAEAERGVGSNGALTIYNFDDPARRDSQIEAEAVSAQSAFHQLFLQNLTRMRWNSFHHNSALVIIYDLDVVYISRAKIEADSPSAIYRYRPLAPPVTFETVQMNAP
jgi:hypothetical protein